MTRNKVLGIAVAAICLVGSAGASVAQSYRNMSCDDLWTARNQIYADEGFCFKTQDAIDTFGRGCFPPYGKLSSREQRDVSDIQMWESRHGCN